MSVATNRAERADSIYDRRNKKPRQRVEALTGACNRATSSQVVLKRSTVLEQRWIKIDKQRRFPVQIISNMPAAVLPHGISDKAH